MHFVGLVILLAVHSVAQSESGRSEFAEGLSTTGSVQVPSGSLSCYDKELFLSSQIKRNQNVQETLTELAKKESQLIIFGESHEHSKAIARYPEFIEVIRSNRGVDCIFIEGKDRFQLAIDKYFNGEPFSSSVDAVNKQVADKTPLAQASKSLLDYAKSKKIKVFAVDTESEHSFERDAHMSKRIGRLMKGECSKPVMLVGKTHVYERLKSSHPKAENGIPLPDRVRNLGVSVSSINMISHSSFKNSYSGDLDTCLDPLSIPSGDFGFPIKSPAPAIERSVFEYFESEKWDDYQAAIVVN